MKFRLHIPTINLLQGLKGIELGAASHNPFGVDAINVAPALSTETVFDNAQRELCGEIAKVDLRGHAADIPVEDGSQDFVLSSHVLEHAPDLLRTFLEMTRVVKPGGYILIIWPQPDALPQDQRLNSTAADLWRAYDEAWTFDTAPEGFSFGGYDGHYWKMDCAQFEYLVNSLRRKHSKRNWPGLKWDLVGKEDPDSKVGNGYWLAYQVEK